MPRTVPRHFVLVFLKVPLAALRPAKRQFHRSAGSLRFGGILRAFIEGHDDVGAEANLSLSRALGGQKVRRPIQMRTKRHAVFGDFPEIAKAENLESAGVGQNCARPRHECVESAESANLLDSRPEIKVIGIAEQNFYAEILQYILRNGFHCGLGTDRHEHWGVDLTVRGAEPPSAQFAFG